MSGDDLHAPTSAGPDLPPIAPAASAAPADGAGTVPADPPLPFAAADPDPPFAAAAPADADAGGARPEALAGAAFAGGLLAALILKRLGRD